VEQLMVLYNGLEAKLRKSWVDSEKLTKTVVIDLFGLPPENQSCIDGVSGMHLQACIPANGISASDMSKINDIFILIAYLYLQKPCDSGGLCAKPSENLTAKCTCSTN
jgi:hypothetical protein